MVESTVFIRNIHYEADSSEIAAALQQFGTVKSCRILTEKYRGEEYSKGVGFAEFTTVAEAKAAISSTAPIEVRGRELRLFEARPPRQIKRDTVFATRLPQGVTKEQIMDAFRSYNPVDVRIVTKRGQDSSPFAFVKLSSEEDPKAAVTAENKPTINGQQITVRYARRQFDEGPQRRRRYNLPRRGDRTPRTTAEN